MQVQVVGAFGVGLSFFTPNFPIPGETVSGASFLQTPGGKGSNQAVALAKLGVSVGLTTMIGPDPNGKIGLNLWQETGVAAQNVKVANQGETMVGAVLTDGSGENCIVIADGVLADYTPQLVSEQLTALETIDICLLSCELPSPTIWAAAAAAKALGATTILNPAPLPDFTGLNWQDVDMITPNLIEAQQLFTQLSQTSATDLAPTQLAEQLAQNTNTTTVITCGSNGVVWCAPGDTSQTAPALRAERVIDTTGAGDSFNAGFTCGVSRGLSLPQAILLGQICGAITVSTAGVIPALPSAAQIADFCRKHQIINPLESTKEQ